MTKSLLHWIDSLPWGLIALIALTLGLAPFAPPHVVEKIMMLVQGTLTRPIDWFDLLFHGSPWILLMTKTIRTFVR
jgi:hypothetical protein